MYAFIAFLYILIARGNRNIIVILYELEVTCNLHYEPYSYVLFSTFTRVSSSSKINRSIKILIFLNFALSGCRLLVILACHLNSFYVKDHRGKKVKRDAS